jgi:hypothetical protein
MQRTIGTIFFEEITVERAIYGGHFVLPAAGKSDSGKPQPEFLTVNDHIQWEPLPFVAGGRPIPRTILGEEIAWDIIEHVALKGRGMSINCGPGIWLVREWIPEFNPDGSAIMNVIPLGDGKTIERQQIRPATPAERARMAAEDLHEAIQRQDRYCAYLVGQGDIYASKPEESILITARMKEAARYTSRDREWLKEHHTEQAKVCQFCTKSVPTAAIVCPNCHQVIDYERFAIEEATRRETTKRAMKAA